MTEEVLETLSFKMITDGYIDILHSEYRSEKVKGKVYAYAKILDSKGSYFVSDDYDNPQEAINDIKKQIKEYCEETHREVKF